MRVLVTGATGFVGSHLVENLLERGYDATVLVRSTAQRKYVLPWLYDGRVEVIYGDITDFSRVKTALKDMDVVFHLAALLGSWGIPEQQYYHVNVYGTRIIMEQSVQSNVDHVIYLSSTGVMGRLITLPADINHPCNPITAYEKSKYQAELLVRKSINEEHFPATIIRSTHVYGPRDYNTLQLYKLMKILRILPLPQSGRSLFQPIYYADLIQALVLCMEKDVSRGKTYIVAGSETITFKDFFNLSAKIMGIKVFKITMPSGLIHLMASINERVAKSLKVAPILTHSRKEFFERNHVYDTNRIRKDLGFNAKVPLKDGLRETIRWYNEQGLLNEIF